MSRKTVILVILLVIHPVLAGPGEASEVPAGFSEVVILATNSIHLSDDVEVRSGDVVANNEVLGPTLDSHVELSIGRNVTTPGGFELQGDSIVIGRGSLIASDVAYNDLTNDGTITGTQTATLAVPVFPFLPPFQTGAPGPSDVVVGKNDTAVVPPGDYGELDVAKGGTVVFSGGLYGFRAISTDKEAALLFEQRSQIRVAERVRTKKDSVIGPAPSSDVDASEIIFYVAGTNVSDGNLESAAAVVLERDNLVLANFYVPDGKLHFKQSVDATGAFVARDVLAEKGARFALNSFFNEPPEANDDSATVDEGGTVSVLDSSAASVLANDTDPNDDHLTVTTTPVAPPDHGVLTLHADGTFSYTHDGSETTSDRFVYEVCDDGTPVECDTATVTFTIHPVNDPPVAADDAATTDEDVAVTIQVLANDGDVDGDLDPASVTVTSPPSQGSTAVSSTTGEITYTPDPDTHGGDGFTYRVCDDGTPLPALCDTATVSVTIHPVNDPPVAADDVAATDEDVAVTIDVLANDGDVDGDLDPASVTVTSPPSQGSTAVSPASGEITYTPDPDTHGGDGFTYQVCDDGTPLPARCGTATVSVTIHPVNDPPVAADDDAATDEDVAVTINVLANDVDVDGHLDPASVTVTSPPSRGSTAVSPTSGKITYTPDPDTYGGDRFTYRVCDDGTPLPALCDTGTVSVTIHPVNDPPVAADDVATTDEDVAVTIDVLANDVDVDGTLDPASVTVTSPASQGSTAVSPTTGEITYTPDPDTHGGDGFTYRVCDDGTPLPVRCDTATVSVTIQASVNNPPRPNHTVVTTNGSTPILITLTAADVDGDPLTFSISPEAEPTAGTLSNLTQVPPTSATVLYTPGGPDDLEDVFLFEVCDDGTPVLCGAGRVRINVSQGPNNPPAAAVDRAAVPRGGTVTSLDSGAASLLANDSDPNGNNLTVTPAPVVAPQYGTVVLSSNGTFRYTHDGTASFTDDFVYELCDDGTPVLCDTAPVFIVVRPTDTIRVTITRQGTGSGLVVSDLPGIHCGSICMAKFTAFERIPLFATADAGSVFVGWSGDGDCDDAFLDGDADKSCIATFELKPPTPTFALTIVNQGEGSGTISSNPRGLICSADCSADFEVGSTIVLLARPDDGASVFQGYGGDADCFDGVITLGADTVCTATFDPAN